MTESAVALKAGRTVKRGLVGGLVLEPEHLGPGVERWRVQRTAGAKNGYLAHVQGGGDMHQAGIVADGAPGGGYRVESLCQRCLSGQVEALARLQGVDRHGDFFAKCIFLG